MSAARTIRAPRTLRRNPLTQGVLIGLQAMRVEAAQREFDEAQRQLEEEMAQQDEGAIAGLVAY